MIGKGAVTLFCFTADLVCRSILELTAQRLRAQGISLLLADLDNTLVPYSLSMPTPELLDWRTALDRAGVTLFVVSNNRHDTRVAPFCRALGVPYVTAACKPRPDAFLRALESTGLQPEQALVVGDQIFTDVFGARRAGLRAVLVQPIALKGYPLLALRYALELPFRRRCTGRCAL